MRYLSVLFASQPDTPPPPELFEAIMTLGQEATAAGVMLDMGGLLPQTRTDVTVQSGDLSVLDGPFTETKELVSYVVYEVRSQAGRGRVGPPLHGPPRQPVAGLERHLTGPPGDDRR